MRTKELLLRQALLLREMMYADSGKAHQTPAFALWEGLSGNQHGTRLDKAIRLRGFMGESTRL